MSLEGLLHLIRKKDDDAQVIQVIEPDQESHIEIETDLELDALVADPADQPCLLEEAAQAPLTDVYVSIMYFVFMRVSIMLIFSLLVGSIAFFLFQSLNKTYVIVCLSISWFVFLVVFSLACGFVKSRVHAAYALVPGYAASFGVGVGILGALLKTLSALQVLVMLFVQCIVLVAYTHFSPRGISAWQAAFYAFVAMLLVWSIGIYAFVLQNDWVQAAIILSIGIFVVGYNIFFIRIAKGKFTAAEEEKERALVYYLTMPIAVWLI